MQTLLQEQTDVSLTPDLGHEMHQFIAQLFPLCRSITGAGTLDTLKLIKEFLPIQIHSVATGTRVYDWTVPKEWNIRDAYIKDGAGRRIVDFKKSNLHVVSYSVPVQAKLFLRELKPHLHSLPDQPDLIPYRTSYYQEEWGFCLTHNQLESLHENELYEVCIDSSLEPGQMHYGEMVLKGESDDEVLISTHICHPSMCNDNLSGIAVAAFLASRLMGTTHRYSYRFLFSPATIGPITWLARNEAVVGRIRHGLVAALLGNDAPFTYRRSRMGNAAIDEVATYVLSQLKDSRVFDFEPYGYDQRQFCSPGTNLPVGSLTRSLYGEFPEYHTSADNLDFVTAGSLEQSLHIYERIVHILEHDRVYINLSPRTEPQLGRRGLYNGIGGDSHKNEFQRGLLWVLNFSDGDHTLLDIARRSAIRFETLAVAASRLEQAGLLAKK
jgi:aminopeptidase-like protein